MNMDSFWPGFVTGFVSCAVCVGFIFAFAFTGDDEDEISDDDRAQMAEMREPRR